MIVWLRVRGEALRRYSMPGPVMRKQMRQHLSILVILLGSAPINLTAADTERLRFNRDIRPILSNHCYQCHGPDSQTRQGGLRLDRREQAIVPADSGSIAIVPGQVATSQLVQRILSNNDDAVMPPREANKPLTARQKDLLKRWIEEGAEYEPHWSYLTPQRPRLPEVTRRGWSRNAIDTFILAKLESAGLQPSPEAELPTLLRRLSLDLTGLPPNPADVDAFVSEMKQAAVADAAANNASSAKADAVYTNWVNRLLDSQHYGERMAVDWLDAARFADTNGYQVDRDREMYAWRDWVIQAFNSNMPFDQFTTEQLAGDLLPNSTVAQKIATGFNRNHMMNEEGGVIPEEFLAEYCADRVETTAAIWLGQTFTCSRCHDHKFDPFTQRDYYELYAFFHNVTESGLGNYGAHIRRSAPPFLKLAAPEIESRLASFRAEREEIEKRVSAIDAHLLTEQPAWEEQLRKKVEYHANNAEETPAPVPDSALVAILEKRTSDRTEAETKKLQEFQQSLDVERRSLASQMSVMKKKIDETENQIPTTLVMEELPQPRVTRILMRGVYDRLGDTVEANTPASLPGMAPELPKNRLGLARWLVDPANPLTARVTVNRLWQSVFGVGLVRTSEDFGTQGELPSHPELLDWLADEFIRSGWDVKHTLRLIVTSSTYRQSSRVTSQLAERDPENRLLARGPRFRLQAEFLRDQALAVSGLLVSKVGGPSVKPYHPAGLYEQITAGSGTNTYVAGTGDDLFRRSMYTYWKRSVPNPAMLAFDVPFRESCALRRVRTNTPIQALNLMNDPTYIEAARFLAGRMMDEAKTDLESRIHYGFRLVVSRPPRPAELNVLATAYHRLYADFQADVASAEELLKVGTRTLSRDHNPAELAAMTIVASTILNSDEAVTKE